MKSESRIQQECIVWMRNTYGLKHHEPRLIMGSIPNDGMNAQEQMRKIQTGLLKGASDTFVILPNGVTLWVEFKDDKGKQSPAQIEFQNSVELLGHCYYLVRSLDEFKKIIENKLE